MWISHDAFDVETLVSELENQFNNKENKEIKAEDITRGSQYLIFMVTTWEKNTKAVKHVVARYSCGDGISSNFLLKVIPKIIVSLHRYGFTVNNVVGDGATENRTAVRSLATLTMRDISFKHLSVKQKDVLDMELKIAFYHPIDKSLIFIGSDMPHLVKKICNAFENSSEVHTRNLKRKGEDISLRKLKIVWKCDGGKIGDIRTNILTEDHFKKNSYSRMRVHLAVQIFSQGMLQLIQAHGNKCGGAGNFSQVKIIIEKIDR